MAEGLSTTLANAGFGARIGVANTDASAGRHGFCQVLGSTRFRVDGATLARAQLYASVLAGTLADEQGTNAYRLDGIVPTEAAAVPDVVAGFVNNPTVDAISSGMGTPPPPTLMDADAGVVFITAVGSVDVDATQTLRATVVGAVYDTIAYAWEVVTGTGTITGTGETVTYNAPSAAEATEVRCTVTVTGTGTNALDGTSDTASDTEDFNVVEVAPPMTTTRYIGWSADRTIATADLAGFTEFTGDSTTVPATGANAYMVMAFPASGRLPEHGARRRVQPDASLRTGGRHHQRRRQ